MDRRVDTRELKVERVPVMVNLTALALAPTVVNVIDFQGRALDLTAGDSGDYVPVQAFEFVNNLNQQVGLLLVYNHPLRSKLTLSSGCLSLSLKIQTILL